MRIWIFSDLHIEQSDWDIPDPAPEYDVLIAAGDIHDPLSEGVRWLADRAAGRPVIYVPGNHEWYAWRQTSRKTRPGFSALPRGNFRSRLLLAPPRRVPLRINARDAIRVLGGEICRQRRSRHQEPRRASGIGLARCRGLGMLPQGGLRHGSRCGLQLAERRRCYISRNLSGPTRPQQASSSIVTWTAARWSGCDCPQVQVGNWQFGRSLFQVARLAQQLKVREVVWSKACKRNNVVIPFRFKLIDERCKTSLA